MLTRMHKETVYRLGVDALACDEAHCLKNRDSQITQAVAGLPTQRRLLLSGTPVQVRVAWPSGLRRLSGVWLAVVSAFTASCKEPPLVQRFTSP
jgi:hypothetical protein